MSRRSPLPPLEITDEERRKLEALVRRPKTEQRLVLRAKIILTCSSGMLNQEVAEEVGTRATTVGVWRKRFLKDRIDGLDDRPRSGTPRKITDEKVEEIISKTLESKPKDATHWSTRSLAKETGVGNKTISRIWRAAQLKPHRQGTFKLSEDPFFLEKTRDIVGLYMNPPDRAIVLCVDEKSQVQALDRTQPMLPLSFGDIERRTHDYVRNGVTSLFAALNTATGEVIGKCQTRHRAEEFVKFLNYLDSQIPKVKNQKIHLVMDNYQTHKTKAVKRWQAKHPRYVFHFTPTSASWLNQVERFFAEITRKRIRRDAFRSVAQLEKAMLDYIKTNNENPKPFVWTADAEKIFGKIERLCTRISDTGH